MVGNPEGALDVVGEGVGLGDIEGINVGTTVAVGVVVPQSLPLPLPLLLPSHFELLSLFELFPLTKGFGGSSPYPSPFQFFFPPFPLDPFFEAFISSIVNEWKSRALTLFFLKFLDTSLFEFSSRRAASLGIQQDASTVMILTTFMRAIIYFKVM